MRRLLLAAAATLVLLANLWGLIQSSRNRSEPSGGRLELTERELGLADLDTESTATVLRLNWNVARVGGKEYGPTAWLDAAKLTELGFDCRVSLTNTNARQHYRSMPPKLVYLAMEYDRDASRKTEANQAGKTRLWVVDAARDPARLRQRFPDPQQYIICRGLVRLGFREQKTDGGDVPTGPRLEGWVQAVCPMEVFVPLPHNRVLRELRRTGSMGSRTSPTGEPRYAVRICWGANYEPWVEGVRLLGAEGPKSAP